MSDKLGPSYWGVDDNSSGSDRGMSEAVVVLLLIGIAVIVVALIALFVFDLVPTGGETVQANLQFTQTSDEPGQVTIYHGGGDPLPDGTNMTAGGDIVFNDSTALVGQLSGLSPGEEVVIQLDEGLQGDRMSVVYEGTVIENFQLLYDVTQSP